MISSYTFVDCSIPLQTLQPTKGCGGCPMTKLHTFAVQTLLKYLLSLQCYYCGRLVSKLVMAVCCTVIFHLAKTHPTVKLSCSENTSETNLFTMQVFPTPLSYTRQRRTHVIDYLETITTDSAPNSPREGRASLREAPF